MSNPGFFSDPKVMMALVALILSVGTFVWNLANQWEQNRRWNALNAASIEVVENKFSITQEMPDLEIRKLGSTAFSHKAHGSVNPPGKALFVYFLRVKDKNGNKIADLPPAITPADFLEEKKKFGSEFTVTKIFTVQFAFENVGRTEGLDFIPEIDLKGAAGWDPFHRTD